MSGRCLIITGGEYCRVPAELRKADCVIACDRGYVYAERMGITPDLIIGDFDSAPEPETSVPVRRVPSRKDDTDTMLAARYANEQGYTDVAICCCFGGRLDHTMANLQTASWLAARGACVRLAGKDTEALVFAGGTRTVPRRNGWSLSLFSMTDRCEGVSIQGTAYEGDGITVTSDFPIGVSNCWAGEKAEISVREGTLMVIMSKLKKGEHI